MRDDPRTAWERSQARVIREQQQFRKEQEEAAARSEDHQEGARQILWLLGWEDGGRGERYVKPPLGIF